MVDLRWVLACAIFAVVGCRDEGSGQDVGGGAGALGNASFHLNCDAGDYPGCELEGFPPRFAVGSRFSVDVSLVSGLPDSLSAGGVVSSSPSRLSSGLSALEPGRVALLAYASGGDISMVADYLSVWLYEVDRLEIGWLTQPGCEEDETDTGTATDAGTGAGTSGSAGTGAGASTGTESGTGGSTGADPGTSTGAGDVSTGDAAETGVTPGCSDDIGSIVLEPGQELRVQADAYHQQYRLYGRLEYSWVSSDPSVLSVSSEEEVDNKAVLRALRGGEVTLRVTAGGYTEYIGLTVYPGPRRQPRGDDQGTTGTEGDTDPDTDGSTGGTDTGDASTTTGGMQ